MTAIPCVALALLMVWLSARGVVGVGLLVFADFLSIGACILSLLLWKREKSRNRVVSRCIPIALCASPILSVIITHWPLRIALGLSFPAFETLAEQVRTSGTAIRNRKAGMFLIREAEVSRHGIPCLWLDMDPTGYTGFVRCSEDALPFNAWSRIKLNEHWQLISED